MNVQLATTFPNIPRRRRVHAMRAAVSAIAVALALPATVLGAAPERFVFRDHKTLIEFHVTDDVCGDLAGSQGLRSGWFREIETGHRQFLIFEDSIHIVDVETGVYSYDFDDPSIPDVSGYRYASPSVVQVTKGGTIVVMENIREFVPGDPDGITLTIHYHLTYRDGAPVVERELLRVTGCP